MRKRLPPDKRLDWRDPNMPAYEDGFRNPEEITRMAQLRFASSNSSIGSRIFPEYKNDPSYDWAKECKSKSRRRMSE